MSHLIINQNELLSQFHPEMELTQLIKHYENEFEKLGEVVCKISVNDLNLNEDAESKFGKTQIQHIKQFEIETENTQILLKNVLSKWREELPQLIDSADKASAKIRFEGLEKGYILFSQFIDVCHYFVTSLSHIRSLVEKDHGTTLTHWKSAESQLWDIFQNLLDACSSKNTNLIADILEYDLAENLQNWLIILNLKPEKKDIQTNGQ